MHINSKIASTFQPDARAVVYQGDCMELLTTIPKDTIQLIVTSPPYNIGKSYERRSTLDVYLQTQRRVIAECVRVLKPHGSICWQVGNYVDKNGVGSIVPLDIAIFQIFSELGLKLRNRIIWHFEHGLHCSNRFSGRYETILWFTKTDDYVFNLDPVRVPQKYPGKKYFKGPKAGQYSCNPLGKNPGDLWSIPNVKSNHVEKTQHPCQFPMELIERLILSMTNQNDWVLDPFSGVGTTMAAAILHGRRGAGAELVEGYNLVARTRIRAAFDGNLKRRPMNTPIFDPVNAGKALRTAPWQILPQNPITEYPQISHKQIALLEGKGRYKAKAAS
jgi:adenine-specific DNA-methyltransferase